MAEITFVSRQAEIARVPEPVVSIAMVMRNASATVWQTIRSLQLQTLKDWELVLLDDGSSDDSMRIVASFNDVRIRMGADGEHRGLAPRLNQGIALCRGRYVARMDADDVCFPNRLEKQVAFLESHPEVDLVGCGAAVFSDDGALVGLLPVPQAHNEIVSDPSRGFPLPHPTWCGRIEWFRENSYDPALMRAQDQDLLLRSYSRSSFASLPDVMLGYRQQSLVLGKILRGRFVYAGALWRCRKALNLSTALGGIIKQIAKGLVDTTLLGLGLKRFGQRQRLSAVPDEVREDWVVLWRMLQRRDDSRSHALISEAAI